VSLFRSSLLVDIGRGANFEIKNDTRNQRVASVPDDSEIRSARDIGQRRISESGH
jgi:hypothetical protein